jgi:hypothetical protein
MAGIDLFELIGPPSPERARRIVALLRLMPGQRPVEKPQPVERHPKAA